MRILLRGPFNLTTGYGNDLCGLALALEHAGHEVTPAPVSVETGLPLEVAQMFSREITGTYDLGISHVPPFQLKPPGFMISKCKTLIGWTMWERSLYTKEHQKGHRQGRLPFRHYDRIFCYDEVSRTALQAYDPQMMFEVLQGGVYAADLRLVARDWNGTLRFCMVGELHNRKDPFVAIEAFRELREEGHLPDSEFHLKTSVPGLHPAIEQYIPGIHVHTGIWPRAAIIDMYENMHVLLAPSRGEGKNVPALEMQLTGGIAMVTRWGGHEQWLDPEFSFGIDRLLVFNDREGTTARASKDHLKELMRYADLHRDEMRRKGEIAAQRIAERCTWDAVVQKLMMRLESEVVNDRD